MFHIYFSRRTWCDGSGLCWLHFRQDHIPGNASHEKFLFYNVWRPGIAIHDWFKYARQFWLFSMLFKGAMLCFVWLQPFVNKLINPLQNDSFKYVLNKQLSWRNYEIIRESILTNELINILFFTTWDRGWSLVVPGRVLVGINKLSFVFWRI